MMNVGVSDYYWRLGFAYWESLGGLLGVIFQIEGTSLKNWLKTSFLIERTNVKL